MNNQPIIRGGQGRTEQDIRDSASCIVVLAILAILLVLAASAVEALL